MYKILSGLLLFIHHFVCPMSFEHIFKKRFKKVSPKIEYLKSVRMKYEEPVILEKKRESCFEKICRVYLQDIINQETERQKNLGNKFIPIKPLEVLKEIKLSTHIKKLIEDNGQQLTSEFISFYRKYKNVQGAWHLFIANIVAMEDIYEH